MNVQIRVATADEIRSGYVGQQLREFNRRAVGGSADVETIYLNAIDEKGGVVGGLRSYVYLHWLRIELLWVQEEHRRLGVGSELLRAAENRGKAAGAMNALLETFEWQAPRFYERHGYAEVSRINEYIGGRYLSIMSKAL
jgi:ribosomal protein S18 acetylase RimI-like enzyme